jgi:hypothetical protein
MRSGYYRAMAEDSAAKDDSAINDQLRGHSWQDGYAEAERDIAHNKALTVEELENLRQDSDEFARPDFWEGYEARLKKSSPS